MRNLKIRRANAENMRHELRLPLRDAVHRRAAPVMAAEDDGGGAKLGGDGLDGVRVGLEAEVLQVRRGACVAVAHAIEGDGAEAEGVEERDLVAPGEGAVREAVDQEDSAVLLGALWWVVDIGWVAELAIIERRSGGGRGGDEHTPSTTIDFRHHFVLPCLGRGDLLRHVGLDVGDVVSHFEVEKSLYTCV